MTFIAQIAILLSKTVKKDLKAYCAGFIKIILRICMGLIIALIVYQL